MTYPPNIPSRNSGKLTKTNFVSNLQCLQHGQWFLKTQLSFISKVRSLIVKLLGILSQEFIGLGPEVSRHLSTFWTEI